MSGDDANEFHTMVVGRLEQYIIGFGGNMVLAGPPTLSGSLAHFYNTNQDIAYKMKEFQIKGRKPGIHSIIGLRDATLFHNLVIVGTGNNKSITISAGGATQHDVDTQRKIDELRSSIRSIQVLVTELLSQVDKL